MPDLAAPSRTAFRDSRRQLRWLPVVCLLAVLPGTAHAATAPAVFSLSAESLAVARDRIAAGDASLQPAFKKLRADADKALAMQPPSVMDKTLLPASGDRHDYYSFGAYWWPDPSKPDGLPYLRRDGEVSPESRVGTDWRTFGQMSKAVETLGLAYYFTGHQSYARKAAEFVRVWFLNAATRMNPNLQHAQAIPGRNTGRGAGVLDGRDLTRVTDGIALIAGSGAWPAEDAAQFHAWLGQYLQWLLTSKHGRAEADADNNHGTWYDVQASHLALVLGDRDTARRILQAGLKKRIAAQIEPDGSQPREMARTMSFHYSRFNLEALVSLARLGRHVGVDYWNYSTQDGRSLPAALRRLAPYLDPAQQWPKKDTKPGDTKRLRPLLTIALHHLDDAQFRDLLQRFPDPKSASERWQLLVLAP